MDTMQAPDWLKPTAIDQPLVDQPTSTDQPSTTRAEQRKQVKALEVTVFETIFPTVLEKIMEGYTLAAVLREDHRNVNQGAFYRWISRDAERSRLYKEAKEFRTEAWAGKIIEYAEAVDSEEDVQRSKLKVETMKWLMSADNRRTYGNSQQIEFGGSISVLNALDAANSRLKQIPRIIDLEDADEPDQPDRPAPSSLPTRIAFNRQIEDNNYVEDDE